MAGRITYCKKGNTDGVYITWLIHNDVYLVVISNPY